MADLRTSYILDLQGNLDRRARQYGRAFNRMSRTGRRDLGRLRRATAQLGNSLDRMGNRYTALATGVGGAVVGRFLVGFERRLTRLGIAANISDEKIGKLRERVFEVAQMDDVRVPAEQLLQAVEDIVEKTGNLEFAQQNLRNIGLAISATGAEGKAIGGVMAELEKLGVKSPREALTIIDTLAKQGKEAAFTLENLAGLGPRVITAYSAVVNGARPAVDQMRELGAVLQVIREGTGNPEQAATAFEATIRTLADPRKLKLLRQIGIQVFDPEALKEGREQLRPLNELMVEILDKAKGRRTVMGRIFDAEAIRAFNQVDPDSMAQYFNATGDGAMLMQDAARAAGDLAAAIDTLNNAWKDTASSELAGTVESIANAINSIDPKTLDRLIRWGAGAALGLGGLILAAKTIRAGRTVGGMFRRRGGGMGGGVGGVVGSMTGVQPVWVVNMPGGRGGMPGGKRGGMGRRGPRVRTPGRWGMLRRAPNLRTIGTLGAGAMGTAGLAVGTSALVGYGAGTLANKAIEGTRVSDEIGKFMAALLSPFSEEARRSMERMAAHEGRLRAEQQAERAQVDVNIGLDAQGRLQFRRLESSSRDVDVYAGPMGAGTG